MYAGERADRPASFSPRRGRRAVRIQAIAPQAIESARAVLLVQPPEGVQDLRISRVHGSESKTLRSRTVVVPRTIYGVFGEGAVISGLCGEGLGRAAFPSSFQELGEPRMRTLAACCRGLTVERFGAGPLPSLAAQPGRPGRRCPRSPRRGGPGGRPPADSRTFRRSGRVDTRRGYCPSRRPGERSVQPLPRPPVAP